MYPPPKRLSRYHHGEEGDAGADHLALAWERGVEVVDGAGVGPPNGDWNPRQLVVGNTELAEDTERVGLGGVVDADADHPSQGRKAIIEVFQRC